MLTSIRQADFGSIGGMSAMKGRSRRRNIFYEGSWRRLLARRFFWSKGRLNRVKGRKPIDTSRGSIPHGDRERLLCAACQVLERVRAADHPICDPAHHARQDRLRNMVSSRKDVTAVRRPPIRAHSVKRRSRQMYGMYRTVRFRKCQTVDRGIAHGR